MLLTRYAPLRRSPAYVIANIPAAPRLACVKPAASVHPEPGSNSSLYISIYLISLACPATLPLSFQRNLRSNILSFHFRVPCTLSYLSLNMLLVFYQYFNQLAVLTERERKGTNFFFPSKFFLKKIKKKMNFLKPIFFKINLKH